MSAPSRLPPLLAPPDDPSSLLLAGWIGPTARQGFRASRLNDIEIDSVAGTLRLAPTPDSARSLAEDSGSFGGRRPPFNVAVGLGGEIYLLDAEAGFLRRLDPCACEFERVPCFARAVAPERDLCLAPPQGPTLKGFIPVNRLLDPQAIACCDGDLYIADRGHSRVLRFAIAGWLSRGALSLPQSEARTLPMPWAPTGLALDGRGTLYVSDPSNGRIDRFAHDGRWLSAITGIAGVTHLAVDCDDVLYAVLERTLSQQLADAADGAVLSLDGGIEGLYWQELTCHVQPSASRAGLSAVASDLPLAALPPSAWRVLFPVRSLDSASTQLVGYAGRALSLRLELAAAARLAQIEIEARAAYAVRITDGGPQRIPADGAELAGDFPYMPFSVDAAGRLTIACAGGPAVFDRRGQWLDTGQIAPQPRFARRGEFVSGALDSRIEGCIWHRVLLHGVIPAGCTVAVQVTTSDVELTAEEVASLESQSWSGSITAAATQGSWDCLLRAPPKRFLWLRLTLTSSGLSTPCIESILLEFPRVSLRRFLPAVFGADPVGADFTDRFSALFDASLRSIERKLDRFAFWLDPLATPAGQSDGSGDFLTWLASWIGIALTRDWPESRRRHYVKRAGRLYCLRGTPEGLWRQLLLLLGFDRAYAKCPAQRPQDRCVPQPANCGAPPRLTPAEPPPLVLEHFKLRRWLYAGLGRLGDDSVLWGKRIADRSQLSGDAAPPNQTGNAQVGVTQLNSVPDPLRDPFLVFANRLSVFVPARVRDCPAERRVFESLLTREVPAHVQCEVCYVEPRFRVGVQAMLGLDSVIARAPHDVFLRSAQQLGQGTVLSAPPERRRGPQWELGEGRVGTSSALT